MEKVVFEKNPYYQAAVAWSDSNTTVVLLFSSFLSVVACLNRSLMSMLPMKTKLNMQTDQFRPGRINQVTHEVVL